MKLEVVRLCDIHPNPHRDIEHYEYDPEKIAALRASMRKSGVWPNIVTRRKDGDVQLAYGHHRVEAARQEFGPNHEITVIVEPLDEAAMIRMMALENQQEFHSDFVATMESVAAVVKGYAAGDIELSAIKDEKTKKSAIRYAPSFVTDETDDFVTSRSHPYTTYQVGEWLDWIVQSEGGKAKRASDKVYDALGALELIELGEMKPENFRGLTATQAHETVNAAQRERHEKLVQARHDEREAAKAEAQAQRQRKDAERAAREAGTAKKPAKRRHAEYERAKAEAEAQRLDEQAAYLQERATANRKAARAASKIGQDLAREMRSGRLGHKQAAARGYDLARKHRANEEGRPDIDKIAQKVMIKLNGMLDPTTDLTARKLEELAEFRQHISPGKHAELNRVLTKLNKNVTRFIEKFNKPVAGRASDDSQRLLA